MKKLKYYLRNKKSAQRKKLLGSNAIGVIYKTDNGIISLPIEDLTIGVKLGFKGNWNIKEINILTNLIKEDDVIYIIGTHVGTLLIPIAKKAKQVYGYEANKNTFWYMNINLFLNNIDNVQLFQNAVGDQEKEVSFYQNITNTGGSKIKPIKESILYNYDHPAEVKVQMLSLDEHRSKLNLPAVNGMVMDIEGAEYFALKGMQASLSTMRFLYVEYVPHHLSNVANVTNKEFLDLIAPHFSEAKFLGNNLIFSLKNGDVEVLKYLDLLQSENRTEDILFIK